MKLATEIVAAVVGILVTGFVLFEYLERGSNFALGAFVALLAVGFYCIGRTR